MFTFPDLVTSPALLKNLAAGKFLTPTPIQAEAIPPAIEGRDLIATAQTGTGKTLAFALPLLERLGPSPARGPQALILSPTRELALQIHESFAMLAQGTDVRSAVVVGGMNENAQLRALRQGAQVIIATPGRLCDFLDRKLVSLDAIRIAVLDEADRMLDMGFLPAVESILRRTAPGRQTLFFSATLENSVARLVAKHLKDPVRISIGALNTPAGNIDTHVYEVEQDCKLSLLHHLLGNTGGSFLVFARTKRGADRLAKRLAAGGVKAAAIHGDRTQNQRNAALRGFQTGQYRVLVATDVAARGIHVDNIAHVVNYDLPQQPEDFVHRIGRTGRAGSSGIASTFRTHAERKDIQHIERSLKIRLTLQTTPTRLGREVKTAPPPAPAPNAAPTKVRSFRPRRRFAAAV
jgi:ATP-dependent RNA helicase RhlE